MIHLVFLFIPVQCKRATVEKCIVVHDFPCHGERRNTQYIQRIYASLVKDRENKRAD